MIFNIALLQLASEQTVEANIAKGLAACERAKAMGADLALFPEMWQLGYESELMHPEQAITLDDNFIQQFVAKAQELQMAIAITYLGMGDVKPTNNIAIIDMTGKVVLEYAKVHICFFEPDGTERTLEPGKGFQVADLNFAQGIVRIGAMICFDREFPESARSLSLQGAEIIVTPNACELHNDRWLGDVRIAQFRARAFENMVGVALTNYPGPCDDGHSCAFDVDGKQIVMAGEEEGIFLATFDLEKIKDWQQREVWGLKFRRPECYGKLNN